MKPVKRAIAVLIRGGDERGQILAVRRSRDDAEHPGMWGLAAGSFREGESVEDLIGRIGRDKLGVTLAPVRVMQSGERERAAYILRMDLWEARIASGEPRARVGVEDVSYYEAAQWASPEILRHGDRKGSLCCRLGLAVLAGSPDRPEP